MPDIKIKVKPQATIKNIDKRIVGVQKIKNNLITTKEKINEIIIGAKNVFYLIGIIVFGLAFAFSFVTPFLIKNLTFPYFYVVIEIY